MLNNSKFVSALNESTIQDKGGNANFTWLVWTNVIEIVKLG